ncbi:MAG: hypothetical protein ACJ8AI_24140 [Rhodopila sp.]|jgi:hypothetical protein
MFRRRSAAVAPGQQGVESYTGKAQARGRSSPPNRIYWPGALLGTLVGASYPAYYIIKLILEAHPAQPAWNVLIDQGYVYLVAAAAVVPAFITAKVFELLLGAVFQKHDR